MSWQISETGRGDNTLYSQAGTPSLDLRFSSTKSLTDYVTGTNLIDFTRASSGTYVGSDGLIKTATTNYLLRSEEFDSGSTWSTVNISAFGSGSQADIETSPKGTLSADLVAVASGTTNGNGFIYQDVTKPASSITYTATIYAKQQDWDALTFIVHESTSFGNRAVVQVSLTNGSVSLFAALGTFSNASAAPAQLVGNGWYRVNLKFTSGTETVLRYRAYPQNSTSATSNGTNGIYLWGAQLEQSSTVGEYVKTTSTINSAPRFDHDPTTGECLGLLVEESRTNLITQSQALTTSPWGDSAATTSLAPIIDIFGGTTAAFKLTEDNTDSAHYVGQNRTAVASTPYSVSVWFKAGSPNREGRVLLTNPAVWSGTIAPRAVINLDNGNIITSFGFANPKTTAYPNGWILFTGTATSSAAGGSYAFRILIGNYAETYQGDGTSYIYVGPCQLEEGSFPTSYIPTVGAGVITPGYIAPAVTRAADVASISGSNFSSWYRQDEGTVYAEYRLPAAGIGIVNIDDGTANNNIPVFVGAVVLQAASGNAVVAGVNNGRLDGGGSFSANSLTRAAYAIKVADRALSANGSTVDTSATPSTMPVMTQLQIQGATTFTAGKGGTIRRLVFWPARLPNETLQGITQ